MEEYEFDDEIFGGDDDFEAAIDAAVDDIDDDAHLSHVNDASTPLDDIDHEDHEDDEDYVDSEDPEPNHNPIETTETTGLATPIDRNTQTIIVVKPEDRRTSHKLTLFEWTEIISIRATQISQFANCFVDTTGLTTPIEQAERELMIRKCPLILRRIVGRRQEPGTKRYMTYCELWSPNDMVHPV